MPALDMRAARATWTVLAVLGVLGLVYLVRGVLLIFMLAVFFAYLLAPLLKVANTLSRHRLPRAWSLAAVYLSLLALLVTIGGLVANQVAHEAANLAERLPETAKNPEWWKELPVPSWLDPVRDRVVEAVRDRLESGLAEVLPLFQQATRQILSALGSLGFLILVPILSFFFLKDAAAIRDGLLRAALLEPSQRTLWESILDDIHMMLGQYIRALIILSAATFVSFSIFFQATSFSYGVLLASIAALLEFIPVVGPLSGALIATLVGLFSGYNHVALMLVFFGLYRLFQDYVLQPYLLSSGIELHPLLVLFGALAGERIGGIPGMFFAVPLIAILRVIYFRLVIQHREQLVS